MKDIVILGAGGHGKVILDACLSSDRTVKGFLDMDVHADGPFGYPILGPDDLLQDRAFRESVDVIVGSGLPKIHRKITHAAAELGASFATIAHASAILSQEAELSPGCFVNAGVVINAGTVIGDHCIINTRASIDHDCQLSSFVNVAPGVVMAGGVTCGNGVFIGAGAVICPQVTLGENVVVAAGAVVTTDISPGQTVGGIPAKPMEKADTH